MSGRHRRVAQRIAELDAALVEKRRLRDQHAAHAPAPAPRFADVALLLQKLPLIAERLPELPNAELRRLFDALQLTATYHHDRKEVDIEITLHERGLDNARVCPVPPVGAGTDLSGMGRLSVNIEARSSLLRARVTIRALEQRTQSDGSQPTRM